MSFPEPDAFVLSNVSLERPGPGLVLDRISLSVPAHRITAVVGPSGSGKTSLLRLLNRLDEPTAGEILFRGRPLQDYPVRTLRRRVGFIFQSPTLFAGTVRDNLRIAAELAGTPAAEREPRMLSALAAAELEPALLDRDGASLSGGERQRVTIARALMVDPEVLLMDEPTSALDGAIADRLIETVLRMSREHRLTVVLVTHRHREARRASDVAAVLAGGRVAACGPSEEVLSTWGAGDLEAFRD